MESPPMINKFADALKPASPDPARASRVPSNGHGRLKHGGGYFDPAVSKRLRLLATEEDTTVQELFVEALELLFRTRQA